ncbi:acetyltransferase [Staphylococcus gallinarum]|uniref:Acetyltransferase n=1 Tax=Staphylococcus gallinarum TaxID=1293 RepID=A0A380FM80_STAGA|nr:acetyltransferase [Staphylococcus gallinarum]
MVKKDCIILDLDSKYVSSLKLQKSTDETPYNIHMIDLLKDGQKVGFIAIEKHENRMNISSIEVNEDERHHGIAESALRQLSTYIRKHFNDVAVLTNHLIWGT